MSFLSFLAFFSAFLAAFFSAFLAAYLSSFLPSFYFFFSFFSFFLFLLLFFLLLLLMFLDFSQAKPTYGCYSDHHDERTDHCSNDNTHADTIIFFIVLFFSWQTKFGNSKRSSGGRRAWYNDSAARLVSSAPISFAQILLKLHLQGYPQDPLTPVNGIIIDYSPVKVLSVFWPILCTLAKKLS